MTPAVAKGALTRAIGVVRAAFGSRSGWFLLLGLVIPTALSSLTVLATAITLGPQGRGEIAFVLSTSAVLVAVGSFGFYLSAARSREPIPRQYLDATLLLTATISLVVLLVSFSLTGGLLTPLNASLAGGGAILGVGTLFAQRVAQAHVSDKEYFLIGALPALVSSSALLVVVLLGGGVRQFLAAWIATGSLSCLYACWRLFRSTHFALVRPYRLFSYIKASASVGISSLANTIILRSDIVILGILGVSAEVGFYSLAAAIAGIPFLLAEVFSLRAISGFHTHGSQQYFAQVRSIANRAVVVSLLAAGPTAILGSLIILRVIPEFKLAIPPMLILCMAVVPSSYLRVMVTGMSMARLTPNLYLYSATGILFSFLYVPAAQYGALGMALASLAVYGLLFVLIWTARERLTRLSRSTGEG